MLGVAVEKQEGQITETVNFFEIVRLVNDYIGATNGYLNSFSDPIYYEFYRYYCDL